jgi:hypothetical protein
MVGSKLYAFLSGWKRRPLPDEETATRYEIRGVEGEGSDSRPGVEWKDRRRVVFRAYLRETVVKDERVCANEKKMERALEGEVLSRTRVCICRLQVELQALHGTLGGIIAGRKITTLPRLEAQKSIGETRRRREEKERAELDVSAKERKGEEDRRPQRN